MSKTSKEGNNPYETIRLTTDYKYSIRQMCALGALKNDVTQIWCEPWGFGMEKRLVGTHCTSRVWYSICKGNDMPARQVGYLVIQEWAPDL